MLLSTNESSIVSDVVRVDDEDTFRNIDCGEEEEGGSTKDGLADMMQRILHQHVEPSVSSAVIRSSLLRVYSRIDGQFLIGNTGSCEAEDVPDEGDRVESQRQC